MGFVYRPIDTREAMHDIATQQITAYLENALDADDRASLFLSGGSTPGPIYEKLSTTTLPWGDIDIGLVDERWVDENDAASNAALIRKTLLKNQAESARFTPMKTEHEAAMSAEITLETSYASILSASSLAVLGMGSDGHTASWFPNAEGTDKAVDPENQNTVQAILAKPSDVTGANLERMTLTLSALVKCEKILLLITGEEKRQVLDAAIETLNPNLPISHLIRDVSRDSNPHKLTILVAP